MSLINLNGTLCRVLSFNPKGDSASLQYRDVRGEEVTETELQQQRVFIVGNNPSKGRGHRNRPARHLTHYAIELFTVAELQAQADAL